MAHQKNTVFAALRHNFRDDVFLKRLGQIEGTVSKILSLAMVVVILVTTIDLAIVLYNRSSVLIVLASSKRHLLRFLACS